MIEERALPHDLDAEKSVLGAVLIQNEALDLIAGLEPKAFFRRAHQQIFAGMLTLHAERAPIDFTLLANRLRETSELEAVGGMVYLTSLVDGLPHVSNVEHHVKLIREKAALRELVSIGAKLQRAAYAAEQAALDVVAEADAALMQLAGGHVSGDLVSMSSLMLTVFPLIEHAYEHKKAITGLQTGWRELDDLTLGLHPGTLIYLAGQTSQGKSSLGLNIAVDVARQGHSVAVFSLEDSRDMIGLRAIAAESRVSLYRMRSGYLNESDWPPLSHAVNDLGAQRIWIDDSARLTVPELRAKCRRLQAASALDLILVDYVQLMSAPGKYENRTRELGAISAGLKQVAKELRVPLIACSQLNRENVKEVRRPRLSDLRESGNLEQDADLVLLIYRPEQHDPTPENEGLAELIIAKQKQGPTGTVKLKFEKQTFRFTNWPEMAGAPEQREFYK